MNKEQYKYFSKIYSISLHLPQFRNVKSLDPLILLTGHISTTTNVDTLKLCLDAPVNFFPITTIIFMKNNNHRFIAAGGLKNNKSKLVQLS